MTEDLLPPGGRRPRMRPRARSRPVRWFIRLAVLVGFIVVAVAGWYLLFADEEDGRGPDAAGGSVEVVRIAQGMTAGDVASLLEERGIVDSARMLRAQIRLAGAGDEIKPGLYEFTSGQSMDSIIYALREGGRAPTYTVTIPEGLAVDQTAQRLDESGHIEGAEYERLASSPDEFEVPPLGGAAADVESLEGLLFPSTYELAEDDGAERLISLQLETFGVQTAGLAWERAEELGVTPYQAVVIASLIEKEARIPEERRKVSAVIYNRLDEGMPLGIDATIRYAAKKWTEPLTQSDLAVDSPYNTRREEGIPPGPIASPGLAALEAALDPVDENYLYYVLIDEEGHHFFTDSYEEFLRAKEQGPGQ